MSPVMRMAIDSTANLAALPPGTTAAKIARDAKKQLKEGLEQMSEDHRSGANKLRRHIQEQVEQRLKQLKERSSPKAKKEAEAERKKAIGSARRAAEYDVYKGIMAMMALSEVPVGKCHERAQAFAEHIIKWSPAGHGDNAYIGVAAYQC